jgi:hypothetical protein
LNPALRQVAISTLPCSAVVHYVLGPDALTAADLTKGIRWIMDIVTLGYGPADLAWQRTIDWFNKYLRG